MSPSFSLEALRARFGDSLLLHFGDSKKTQLLLIDGGPSSVYKETLAPRLAELVAERGSPLPLEIVMVSHMDKDHVRGIVDFTEALLDDEDLKAQFVVRALWHNAFEDAVGPAATTELSAEGETMPAELAAVVAGAKEGGELRDNAETLEWGRTPGFEQFVLAPEKGGATVELGELRLTVVGPRQAELDELREKWAEETASMKEAEPEDAAKIASYLDKSVANLSSIVCLAELGGKRMLLTGDARGDKILTGLEAAGILKKGGELELDLVKMPHHGSSRNLEPDFFTRLRARHFVISADGTNDNPDIESLEMLSAARADDEFTVHLTNSEFKRGMGPKVHGFFEAERKKGRKYEVSFRAEDQLSLRVDLLEPPR
jgi:Metallo-beta-lactamase superfamily